MDYNKLNFSYLNLVKSLGVQNLISKGQNLGSAHDTPKEVV